MKGRERDAVRARPREALLCYVDVNSSYGIAAVFASFDGGRVKIFETLKHRPPNQGRRLREAAKRQRAAVHGSKPNVNRAIARLTMKFDSRGWVKAAAAEIFKRAFAYAKGRSILMNFDAPDSETVRNGHLQRTLLSIRKVAENLANWYGIHAEFRCYPSRRCPICGRKLKELKTTRTRIERCECGFSDERDYVPFYWWVKALGLPIPRWPLGNFSYKQSQDRKPERAGPAGNRLAGWSMSGYPPRGSPAALARAGRPRGCNTLGGGRAGSDDRRIVAPNGVAIPWGTSPSSKEPRANPTAAHPRATRWSE